MVSERQIFGGEKLMNFFCKDAVEGNKEYCRFIVDYENKCIYIGISTSYEDGDVLYNDLLNLNIKWNVTFEADNEVLQFKNREQYVEFDNVNYNDVKGFLETKIKQYE